LHLQDTNSINSHMLQWLSLPCSFHLTLLVNNRLVEQFGSTRRKRQLTAKENAVVRADAVGGAEALKDMLRSAADKAAESNMTKDEIIKQTQALRAIPPHHPEAVKPHDAYR